MYISLLMDVEDIITPEADDITRDIAAILAEEGARATFCIAGERARQWRARRREDVIEALASHDVGVHTDFHSVHPTIAEYLEDKGWDDGVEEALRRERPAVESVRDVLGADPSCWGGPGNTWGPQINEAMRQLGVPAMVYAHTRVADGGVHRYCGILAYPGGTSVGDDRYHRPAEWERRMQDLAGELEAARQRGCFWMEVFIGHPSRILHEEFWDGPNFSHGRNPPPSEWVRPRRRSDEGLRTALASFRATTRILLTLPGIQVRTIREMNALLAGAREEFLMEVEQEEAWQEIEPNLRAMAGWVIHRPGLDTPAIRRLAQERLHTLRRLRAELHGASA